MGSGVSSFRRVAQHSFGRKSCVRHRRSFCFLWNHPDNFIYSSLRNVVNSCGPPDKALTGFGSSRHSLQSTQANGQKARNHMNLNQLTIIGFIGRNAETKQIANGAAATKFSVATTRSWKDDNGEWKAKTQWHNIGVRSASPKSLPPVEGTRFLQGELSTREYDRTITIPNGKNRSSTSSSNLLSSSRPIRFEFWIAPLSPRLATRFGLAPQPGLHQLDAPHRDLDLLMLPYWHRCVAQVRRQARKSIPSIPVSATILSRAGRSTWAR